MSINISPSEEVTVLRPESISIRKLPINFKQNDQSLFSHELERVIPPTRLLRFNNVGVSPEGILFKQGKMLPESFAFPENRESWKRRSVLKFFFKNYLLRKHRQFARESVWVTDNWSLGYFHWLADVLPRLLTIRPQLKNLVLLLPHRYKELGFTASSLRPFQIGGLEFIDAGEVLFCRELLVPTHTAPSGHYNEELIREVGKIQVGFHAGGWSEAPNDRIYISRSLAPKRKISNEDEVMEVLREFRFQIVRPEDHSFAEQVQIAAKARYFVSNHGSNMTNILFMKPGTNVLELRHVADRINNCYFTLASALKLNYFYQKCEPQNPGEDAHTANLRVDPRMLRANLELILKS